MPDRSPESACPSRTAHCDIDSVHSDSRPYQMWIVHTPPAGPAFGLSGRRRGVFLQYSDTHAPNAAGVASRGAEAPVPTSDGTRRTQTGFAGAWHGLRPVGGVQLGKGSSRRCCGPSFPRPPAGGRSRGCPVLAPSTRAPHGPGRSTGKDAALRVSRLDQGQQSQSHPTSAWAACPPLACGLPALAGTDTLAGVVIRLST
jgi:hypothetical protein